jgi:tRNA G37 N-methylase TrmD
MKPKGYNFRQSDVGNWAAYHNETLICGSYPTQEDAVIALAGYIREARLHEALIQRGVAEEKLLFKNYGELREIEKQLDERGSLTDSGESP